MTVDVDVYDAAGDKVDIDELPGKIIYLMIYLTFPVRKFYH